MRSLIGLQPVIVWLVIFIILFIQISWLSVGLSFIMSVMTEASLLAVYYATYLVLVPKLLVRGKKVAFALLSILLIIALTIVCVRLEVLVFGYFDVESGYEFRFVFSGSRFFTLFTLSYAISNITFFTKRASRDAKQREELMSEKKLLEARVLKSQINSHFIFNALNNIYSMIYFKDEYTSGYVLRLAKMMRYVMEDCETELTSLHKDIEYIENFIDFQKIRFEGDKDIVFACNLPHADNFLVPPMIFQPLVENCFKHAPLDMDENSYIHIRIDVEDDNKIHFVSENSQPLIKAPLPPKSAGIGIENVKRRLDLYYGDNYKLDISDETDFFKVELFIYL